MSILVILAVDNNPDEIASALDDFHLLQQLETVKDVLCNVVHWVRPADLDLTRLPSNNRGLDDWCVWTRANRSNYIWGWMLYEAMIKEGESRGLTNSTRHRDFLSPFYSTTRSVPVGDRTAFPNITPLRDVTDVVLAYRVTLCAKWRKADKDGVAPQWSPPSSPPQWIAI